MWKMSAKNPSEFTVSQLKEKLRELGLSSVENKNELISRLIEADPIDEWTEGMSEMLEACANRRENEPDARTSFSVSYL